MSLEEIKQELDKINSRIFIYSLNQDNNLEELVDDYGRLSDIKDKFIEISINKTNAIEMDEIRFGILEEVLTVKILIKEKVGQDVIEDIEKLKHIYENNEKVESKNK